MIASLVAMLLTASGASSATSSNALTTTAARRPVEQPATQPATQPAIQPADERVRQQCLQDLALAIDEARRVRRDAAGYERAAEELDAVLDRCEQLAADRRMSDDARQATSDCQTLARLLRSAQSAPRLRQQVLQLLQARDRERLSRSDRRLPMVFELLRRTHPGAQELFPRAVQVRLRAAAGIDAKVRKRLLAEVKRSLGAVGFEVVEDERAAAGVETLQIAAEKIAYGRTTLFDKKHVVTCEFDCVAQWRNGHAVQFGTLNLWAIATGAKRPDCATTMAARAGSTASLALLESWLRRNP